MPWTEQDLDVLRQAVLDRKGARSIQFSDQAVTFESIDDMLKLMAVIKAEISPASRTRLAATRKGV